MDDDDTGALRQGHPEEDVMQRSISIPFFIPSISPRPGRAVRLKLPSIA